MSRELSKEITWSLKGIMGEFEGNTLPLSEGSITIGRIDQNHVVINDANVSRHHATIFVTDGLAHLQDEKSRNGIFLNEKKIEPNLKISLNHGDRIQIGPHAFIIEQSGSPHVAKPRIEKRDLNSPKKVNDSTTLLYQMKNNFGRFKIPQINWNRRTLMYGLLGIVLFIMLALKLFSGPNRKTKKDGSPTKEVTIQATTETLPTEPLSEEEMDTLKARAKAALQFQDYLAATELYEKINLWLPNDEYIKTQYAFSKKQLKLLIEIHLEYAKREYEKLDYERAIIEWKQVLALTSRADPETYKQTEAKIRDVENELRKRR